MSTTQLLLLEDVESLGRSGDVVGVKSGYGRNFLQPKGLAVTATRQTLRRQAQLQEERAKKAATDRGEAEALVQQFEGKVVTVVVKVDPEGHMYGSVSALDVARLVHEQLGCELAKHNVMLEHPIKTTGTHEVDIKLPELVYGKVTLKVTSEEASAEDVVGEGEEPAEGTEGAEPPAEE